MTDVTDLATLEDARAKRLKAIEAVCVHGMNKREAAAFCGLKTRTLNRLLEDPRVKQYMQDMQQAHAKRLNVKREQVIQGYLDAIEHAKATNEPAVEIRGWEAIAKMQGYNAPDRVLHDLSDDAKRLVEEMKDMDDSQVAQLAEQDDLLELKPGKDYHDVAN